MKIVTIKLLAGISHKIDVGGLSTVQELVDELSIRHQIEKSRIRLVHKGKIMGNEFSLDFYKIRENDVIVMSIQKPTAEKYVSPKQLFKKFINLINKLEMLDYDDFMKAYREIHEIAENSVLKNFANRNTEMKRTILDALNYADSIEKPISPATINFLSKNQDLCFNQIEGSPEGYRGLTAEYLEQLFDQDSSGCEIYFPYDDTEDELNEDDYVIPLNQMSFFEQPNTLIAEDVDYTQAPECSSNETNLDYSPSISTKPLPLPNSKKPFKIESSYIFNDRDSRISGVNVEGIDYLFMK